jgi:transcriptional regulator with XRE-family HTH domain
MNDRLKTARITNGWTQEFVARQAGIGRTTYIRIEQGTQQPRGDTIERLCVLFHASPELLGFLSKKQTLFSTRFPRKERHP